MEKFVHIFVLYTIHKTKSRSGNGTVRLRCDSSLVEYSLSFVFEAETIFLQCMIFFWVISPNVPSDKRGETVALRKSK